MGNVEHEARECPGILSIIPVEILSEIFLHCANGIMDYLNTIDTPLLVSNICKKWRAVALSTPRLWSRIFICISEAGAASQGSLMETWMARSGACALTIFLFWEEPTRSTSHPAVEAMVRHCTRWQNMSIFMPSYAFDSLGTVTNQLPLLRELSLGTGDRLPDPSTRAMFQHAPQLHSFECVNFSPFQFLVPWCQLREIPVLSAPLKQCLQVISRSSVLEEATLIPLQSPSVDLPATQSATVVRLTLLSDPWNLNVLVTPFFESLSAPKLVSLKLVELRFVDWLPLPTFLSKSTALSVLELRRTYIQPHAFIHCLRSIPSLVRLIVEPVSYGPPLFDGRLLSELTITAHRSSSLVPKLTDLAVLLNEAPFTTTFADMVESRSQFEPAERKPDASRMRWVRIKTVWESEPGIDERMATLRENGLDIVIGSDAYA